MRLKSLCVVAGFSLLLLMGAEQAEASCSRYGAAQIVGFLPPEVDESSGLVASRENQGIFWTHNDSGGAATIFAIDEKGALRGRFEVEGAVNRDWEDMAAAPCPDGGSCLYIGDIGDNLARAASITIYRIPEPRLTGITGVEEGRTAKAHRLTLRYPDGARDAETLYLHPQSLDLFIISKEFRDRVGVYRLAGSQLQEEEATLEKRGEIETQGDLITGGDISPDGRHVVLRGYTKAFLYRVDADGIPKDAARTILPMPRTKQAEAIAFSLDGRSIFGSSEGKGEDAVLQRLDCEDEIEPPIESSREALPPDEAFAQEKESEGIPQDASSYEENTIESIAENEVERPVEGAKDSEKKGLSGCQCTQQEPSWMSFLSLGLILILRQSRSRSKKRGIHTRAEEG
jgi:hypothetical protein